MPLHLIVFAYETGCTDVQSIYVLNFFLICFLSQNEISFINKTTLVSIFSVKLILLMLVEPHMIVPSPFAQHAFPSFAIH